MALNIHRNLEDRKKFYAMLENSFLQLSQITGVSTFEQMMEKFSLMQLNRGSLEKDKQSAEDKLLATKRKALDLEKKFQELRSEGVKGQHAELNREEAEGLEDLLSQARSEVKLLATIAERLETVSIGLEQAGVSLQQRVEHYTHILDEDVFKLTQVKALLYFTFLLYLSYRMDGI